MALFELVEQLVKLRSHFLMILQIGFDIGFRVLIGAALLDLHATLALARFGLVIVLAYMDVFALGRPGPHSVVISGNVLHLVIFVRCLIRRGRL